MVVVDTLPFDESLFNHAGSVINAICLNGIDTLGVSFRGSILSDVFSTPIARSVNSIHFNSLLELWG